MKAKKMTVKLLAVPTPHSKFTMNISKYDRDKLEYICKKQNISAVTFFTDCIDQIYNQIISSNFNSEV